MLRSLRLTAFAPTSFVVSQGGGQAGSTWSTLFEAGGLRLALTALADGGWLLRVSGGEVGTHVRIDSPPDAPIWAGEGLVILPSTEPSALWVHPPDDVPVQLDLVPDSNR